MKGCKTVLILLTKKWLSSTFCASEAKIALSYNKPIVTLLPPVPEGERVTVRDIPPDHPVHDSIVQRQVLDFSNHTLAEYVKDLPKVFEAVRAAAPLFAQPQLVDDMAAVRRKRITDVLLPQVRAQPPC